ncbi:MAG: ABC transporter permease [Bacteroidota bacterium]|nr:ABC transporter permease [Bacteroidota bacterium]MDP4205830.1 ABC transporter permease [Bacteroidota bacterium]
MKRFIGFIKKEFYHIFRDVRTILILFGIPIAQLLVFGYAIRSEIRDAKIAILDRSHDEVTRQITNKILSSGYFLLSENLQSENQIEPALKRGVVKEVIVFENNFGKNFRKEGVAHMQLIADASDPNIAKLVTNYTRAIVNDYVKKEFPGMKMPYEIEVQPRMFFNEVLKSVYMFVPGIMALILMLISAMMTSISITREKELGTMEILLVSPLRPIQIIVGKVTPYLALSVINASVIISLGHFVFGVPIKGSVLFLMTETMLFILMALSLGILISTTSQNQMEAMFKSFMMLMLPTILLSGLIFPIENMPTVLQWLTNLMPARWYIVIVRDIMLKGADIFYVWKETLILIVMTFVFIGLSVKKFKNRLE